MTLRRTALPLFLLVLCLIALVPFSLGQTETATLSGLITDPQGKVVPDVAVEVTNVDTNVAVHRTTNSAGLYVVVGLKPGRYRVSVSKEGFRRIDLTDLVLNVQDVLSRNFQLQLGPILASITVVADEANLNTTDATVSTVVDRQFAENLPMNGRSFQTLIELTPGVVTVPSNGGDSGQFSINGQRAASNYWMVDGVSANIGAAPGLSPGNGVGGTLGSFSVLGGTNSLVSVDAMQEFRIQTSTFAPEFGRTPGGQISIATRSGTNQFHGTVFDYFRNDILDANDWFNGTTNPPLPKAKERQNDFGGTFNGPIIKDRTFFFFSYEGLRLRLPQTALTTVPDVNARSSAISTVQPFLNAYPLPNGPQAVDAQGNPIPGSAQFNASYSNPATLDAYSIRIDHKLTDKLSLFGRYNNSPSQIIQRGGVYALSALSTSRIATQTATVGTTWAISPATVNDLRFNYSRTDPSDHISLDNFGGAVPLTSLPFPSGDTSQNAIFTLSVDSLKAGSLPVGQTGQNLLRQINIVDSLSMQKASHSLKFGVDFRRLWPSLAPPAYNQSIIFFDVPSTQNGDLAFGIIGVDANLTVLFHNLGAFAQDTWRIAPRLSLTYGLRWDVDFSPSLLHHLSIPAVTGYNLNDFSQLAVARAGTPPFRTTYGNVAPRIGLAYQLTQKQGWSRVLRGGFGIFYDLVSSETGSLVSGVSVSAPFGAQKILLGPAFGGTSTFPLTSTDMAPPPIPSSASISSLYAFNPNLKLPYTLEWNVAFEQALGKQQTITASYVGAAGRRLLQTTSVGAPPTNPNVGARFVDNTATSEYDALQTQFQRRLSRGLQVLASYTWSHSIDTGSAGSTTIGSNAGVAGNNRNANRGPSDFDTRNALSAGVTYDIPAPRVNALANAILRGWSTENFILAHSATPVEISDAHFFGLNGIGVEIRPDLNPGEPLYLFGSQYPGGKAFNPAALADPPVDPNTGTVLRQGNVPRNFLRGFGAAQWDFAVHRDFPIRESLKLQFRAELFNVLNHPNFAPPSGAFGQGGFGLSTQMLGQSLNGQNLGGGALSPLYQIGGPRSIQFALKLSF